MLLIAVPGTDRFRRFGRSCRTLCKLAFRTTPPTSGSIGVARRTPTGFEHRRDRNPPEPDGPLCFTATFDSSIGGQPLTNFVMQAGELLETPPGVS